MVVAMGAGDTLEIVDPEGRQPGELTVFGPAGVNDCGLLGARSTGPSSAMADIVSNAAEDARAVASALRRRGIDAKNAEAVHVFGSESRPGERVTFTAESPSAGQAVSTTSPYPSSPGSISSSPSTISTWF